MVGVNLEAGRRRGIVKSNEESFEALFAAEYARVAGIANRVDKSASVLSVKSTDVSRDSQMAPELA